jgi:hypothetical protein
MEAEAELLVMETRVVAAVVATKTTAATARRGHRQEQLTIN